jgi:hypothetical protein
MCSGQLFFGISGLGFEAAPRLPRCSRAGLPLLPPPLPPPLPLPNTEDRVATFVWGRGEARCPARTRKAVVRGRKHTAHTLHSHTRTAADPVMQPPGARSLHPQGRRTQTSPTACQRRPKKTCPLDAITLAHVFALMNTVGRRFLCFSASCFLAG